MLSIHGIKHSMGAVYYVVSDDIDLKIIHCSWQ